MSPQRRQLKVTLIGDVCFDEYRYGRVDRISPEAPVPIFVQQSVEIKHGMAANVARNLEALGVSVTPYYGMLSTKVRLIDSRSKQHILRLDTDVVSTPLPTDTHFDTDVDGFVISDYDKGFVSYDLVQKVISLGKPVFVDTKKTDLMRFNGAIVKINAIEFDRAKSLPRSVIVTRGPKEVFYKGQYYKVPHVEITDVCGAGDTFLAAFAYQYLMTHGDYDEAIYFAIKAASVTVKHVGVYAPSLEEIQCQD